MKSIVAMTACAMLASAPTCYASPATATGQATCQPSGGYINGPFVPTPSAARRIYYAVRDAVASDFRLMKNTSVKVVDEGDRWDVYSVVLVRNAAGRLTPAQGGGFGMEINKCTGAVSGVGGIR